MVFTHLIITGPLSDRIIHNMSKFKDTLCSSRMQQLGYIECELRDKELFDYSLKHMNDNYIVIGYAVQNQMYNIESPNVWYFKTSVYSKYFKADDFWQYVGLKPF